MPPEILKTWKYHDGFILRVGKDSRESPYFYCWITLDNEDIYVGTLKDSDFEAFVDGMSEMLGERAKYFLARDYPTFEERKEL